MLAAASLVVTGTAQAQSDASRPISSDSMSASASGISRVNKDSVKSRLTAKDLIGAAVYDLAGEKIGDITDIDLQQAVPPTLASSFNAQNAGDPAASPAMDRETSAATAKRSSSSISSSSSRGDKDLSHATIFISVGGLWGIGDDLVSVPASQLSYNLAEERFELSANKADVVALAELDPDAGYAAGTSMRDTAAGKQSFADEASRVQKALETDPTTSAFAYKVTVTSDGENLSLHGTVDNDEQQEKLLEAAKRATSLDIDDKLDVR
jgi:hypothetical protein